MTEDRAVPSVLGAVVVGGGPAGNGVLIAARRAGRLDDLLSVKVRIIERTSAIGPGEIGNYLICSDSLGDMFLRPADLDAEPPLRDVLKLSAGRRLRARRGDTVELAVAAEFLADMAALLRRKLKARDKDPFITGLEAVGAARQRDGSWLTTCRGADGAVTRFGSRAIVLATGAHQPLPRLYAEPVAGRPAAAALFRQDPAIGRISEP